VCIFCVCEVVPSEKCKKLKLSSRSHVDCFYSWTFVIESEVSNCTICSWVALQIARNFGTRFHGSQKIWTFSFVIKLLTNANESGIQARMESEYFSHNLFAEFKVPDEA